MRKISIGYIILSQSLSGTEKHVVDVVRHLNSKQLNATVFCKAGQVAQAAEEAGVEVIILSKKSLKNPLFFLLGVIKFAYHIRRKEIDILHCYLNLFGAFVARLMGIPVVITSRRSIDVLSNSIQLGWSKFVNQITDLIIANSNAARINAIKKEGISPKNITVIYNGVQMSKYQITINVNEKKKQLGVSANCHIIGTVANLRTNLEKGQVEFIQAAAIVVKKIPNVQFLIVGSGPLKPFLESQIKQLNLESNVLIIGSILQSEARKDVNEILQIFDLFVLPSHREGFSNALLEAMAAGKPAIATAVGGNVEAVVDNVTGILIPPKDSKSLAKGIIRLLNNPELAKEMGKRGQERVEREFQLRGMIAKMEQVYTDLAKSAGIR